MTLAAVLALAGCGGGGADAPAVEMPVTGTSGGAEADADSPTGAEPDVAIPVADTPAGGPPATDRPAPDPPPADEGELPVFGVDGTRLPDGSTGADTIESTDAALDDETALRRLESRVATEVVGSLDHESWICTGETRQIEYRFAVAPDGSRRGAELDGRGGLTPDRFDWAAIGADTLLLDYVDVGRQVELGSILFAGDDALRANDSASGPLECRRQRYVDGAPTRDVSVAPPEDVDPDVEAAAALAERIETSRADDGTFDYWYCEIADGRPVGYVFAGEGVLDPDRRAVSFDVGRQDMPAPDEASGVEDEGGQAARRPSFDPETDGGRSFRWLATGGTALVLVPLDADVALDVEGADTTALGAIVFPVDDAFTARRSDGVLLQCLRDGDA